MDPITLIVNAISVAGVLISKRVGGQALEDAYSAFKRLLADRLESKKPIIEALEKSPTSEPRRRALVRALREAKVKIDPDLLDSAQALAGALGTTVDEIQSIGRGGEIERVVKGHFHLENTFSSVTVGGDLHLENVSGKVNVSVTNLTSSESIGIRTHDAIDKRRIIDANLFSDSFEPGQTATLTVTLRLPDSRISGKWQGPASISPSGGPVTVLLETQGFALLSKAPPPVNLEVDHDSPPVAFELRIEAASHRWLHLFLIQGGVQVGELLINDFSAFLKISSPLIAAAPFRRLGEADLTLLVRARDKRIEACSPRDRACLDHKTLGEFRYPEESFRKLLAGRLRGLYDVQSNAVDVARELKIVGVELARCLPVDLDQLFRRPDIRSVMLRHEDDFDFPFELCYLDDPVDPFFVGDRIAICRWYLGVTYPPDVINKKIGKVAYLKGADEASIQAEPLLKQLYGDRMETFENRDEVIRSVFKTDDFDLIHFTGHCRERDNANAGLEMADGSYLRLIEIGQLDSERMFAKAQPFVMLNACASAQPYLGLTHRGSFAHRFVSNNACAILGTLWPVEGSVANEFASEFYRLILNKPVGSALLDAKAHLLSVVSVGEEENDRSQDRLLYRQVAVRSYCLFACPDLRLGNHPSESQNVES